MQKRFEILTSNENKNYTSTYNKRKNKKNLLLRHFYVFLNAMQVGAIKLPSSTPL